ncbi:MAG: hypothetical protein HZC26_03180, partial [Candidatus Magasanikbacteria bacterium]|nr:hypothetical protein [Candidatus Magasanikbacteria bacterium]
MTRYLVPFKKMCILATFLVPFVLIPSKFIFPFIVPKIIIFRAIVLLMAGGYVLLLASNWREYRVRFTLMNGAVGLFFLGFAISTFAGVDWYKSFW